MTNAKSMECFLCQKGVKTKKEYEKHLISEHNVLNPKNMMKMLQKPKDCVKTEIVEESENDKADHKKMKAVRVDVKNIHMDIDNSNRSEFEGVSWFNRVKYECLKCEKTVYGRSNDNRHVKSFHKNRKRGHIKRSFRLLSSDKYFCKICDSEVSMNYSMIHSHLLKVHCLEISDYEAIYEPGKRFDQRKENGKKYPRKESNKRLKKVQFPDVKWYDRVNYNSPHN